MYFRSSYDTDTTEIEKFNDTLNINKYNILIKNVHKTCCAHFMEVQETKYDISVTYDLSNHLKVPSLKNNNQLTSSNGSFHVRFSVLSALFRPGKLGLYICSYRHHCESVVHSRLMIDIIIPKMLSLFYIMHWFIVELHLGLLKVDTATLTLGLIIQ